MHNNHHKLSFFAIFSLVVGSLMGAGIFDIPQNIAHSSGTPAIILSWCITAIGMFTMVLSMLYVNKCNPEIKNGIYGYAQHGFGDKAAFNLAWGYWLSANIGTMGYFTYIFSSLSGFKLFSYFGDGNNLISLLCGSILLWTIYLLICRGIKEASIANVIITILKITSLVFILCTFLYFFNWQQFMINFHNDSAISAREFLQETRSTMMVTVWDFLGIECALVLASRALHKRYVKSATLLALLLVITITSSLSLLSLGILPTSLISHLHTPSTTGILDYCLHGIKVLGIFSVADLVRIAIIISVLGALLAWVLSATHVLFEAAIDGTMPKKISQLNKKHVPNIALLLTVMFLQIGLIVSYFTQSLYIILIQISASMLLFPYLLTVFYACKLSFTTKNGKQNNISTKQSALYKVINTLAVIYVIWLIYAGGLFYFGISLGLYALGNIFRTCTQKS